MTYWIKRSPKVDKIKLSDYTGYDIDLSNVTERELSIAKMFAPYVTLDD